MWTAPAVNGLTGECKWLTFLQFDQNIWQSNRYIDACSPIVRMKNKKAENGNEH